MSSYCLFRTQLGECGIAWRDDLVIASHLPEETPEATAARLETRASSLPSEPPQIIQAAIDAIKGLIDGEQIDLAFIACDFSGLDDFSTQVYEIARQIPVGESLTYGEIAEQLGNKQLARQVGRAMGQNPFPIIVPCHRVVGANNKLTGFSAFGGIETKRKMLAIERGGIGETADLFE